MLIDLNDIETMNYSFRPRHYKLDWKKIASIDFDTFDPEKDFHLIHDYIMNITFCDIENEVNPTNANMNLIKLFKLAQYIIEYMMCTQNHIVKKTTDIERGISNKYKDIHIQKKTYFIMKDKLEKSRSEIKKLHQTLRSYKEIVLLCSLNNWNIKDLIHQCPYCIKAFISDNYLISHLQRRHNREYPNMNDERLKNVEQINVGLHEDFNLNKNKINSIPKVSNQLKKNTVYKIQKDDLFKAKHYVKKRSQSKNKMYNKEILKQRSDVLSDTSNGSLPEARKPAHNRAYHNHRHSITIPDTNNINGNGRKEAYLAFKNLCQTQESRYLNEMKGFRETLDSRMKQVADQIVEIVQDRITPAIETKSVVAHAEPEAKKSIDKTHDLDVRRVSKQNGEKREANDVVAPKTNSKLSGNLKKNKPYKSSLDKRGSHTKENSGDVQVKKLEDGFEKRLREQEVLWQRKLDKLERFYNQKLNKENAETPTSTTTPFPAPAKEIVKVLEPKNIPFVVTSSYTLPKTNKQITSVTHPEPGYSIPLLLEKYFISSISQPNDSDAILKLKMEKSLNKEMTKYGMDNKSTQISQVAYSKISSNLEKDEQNLKKMYPNFTDIRKSILHLIDDDSIKPFRPQILAVAPEEVKNEVLHETVDTEKFEDKNDTASTYTISSSSSRSLSESEGPQSSKKHSGSITQSLQVSKRPKESSQEVSEADEIPTRDIGQIPVLIHQPTSQSDNAKRKLSNIHNSDSGSTRSSYSDSSNDATSPRISFRHQERQPSIKLSGYS